MAASAISFLVQTLNPLIQKEVGLLCGVDNEMKKLSSSFSTILAVLDDAELKQLQQRALQDWLRKLKYAAYEVRDILDECEIEASRLEYEGQSCGSLNKVWTCYPVKNLFFRHNIGNRMKIITENICTISQERINFHLNEKTMDNHNELDEKRETSSTLDQLQVFGREDDRNKIVEILTVDVCDSQQVSIYPIIGMGGLGKTTLAQMVFNDGRVKSHFEPKIWVYVSANFNVKRVMKLIVESISEKICDILSLDSLQKKVTNMLSGKRYLLVLDDAWNEDQGEWDKLKHVLACGSPGACVLVTTRSDKVASIMGTLSTNRLSYLSEDDCWLLFRQQAFQPGNEERPDLVVIGKEIVRKCGGVPLAAKALGGILRFRREESEWVNIKESELWDIPLEECSILPALRLSYYNLPLALRHCFSYCAVFPKGTQIEKDKLIQLWKANCFISSKGNLQVEDIGNRICNELQMRSFFESEEKDWRGKLCFKMHDLMNDLAQSIMEDECQMMEAESFISVRKHRIRHATLVGNCKYDGEFPEALNGHSSLHTVMLQHRGPSITNYGSVSEFSCDFKNFGSLRVFDVNGARMMQLSESVGNSKHLRYLNLSGTLIRELPESICSLRSLETLNLDFCHELRRLPKNLNHLRCLRQLCLLRCDFIEDMPQELGKLKHLKTLSLFVVGESSGQRPRELQHLDLGGQLSIMHLERVKNSKEAEEANLAGKHNLRVLNMFWDEFELQENIEEQGGVIDGLEPHPNVEELSIKYYRGNALPSWMGNPCVLKNVVSICLINCRNCLGLPTLGELPSLRLLKLEEMDELEYMFQNGSSNFTGGASSVGAFPSLEILEINSLPNLKGLSMDEGEERSEQLKILPRLRKIVMWKCPKLRLPTLQALESLKIWHSSDVTLTSISKLTGLTSLVLLNDEKTIFFPNEMLQKLTHLQTLQITGYRKLKVLPGDMSSLVALRELRIEDCGDLEILSDVGLGSIKSLQNLQIIKCPKIVSLPDTIQSLTRLQM